MTNCRDQHARQRSSVKSVVLACALILGGVPLETCAQAPDRPAVSSFHVSWQERGTSIGQAIVGSVSNTSPSRVTNVRLRVEGLNSGGKAVGVLYAWALGDIPPAGETSFVADSIPGAAAYRVSVESFDLVSVTGSR